MFFINIININYKKMFIIDTKYQKNVLYLYLVIIVIIKIFFVLIKERL